MSLTLVLVLFGLGTKVAFGKHLSCYDCHDVKNPKDCDKFRDCDPNHEACAMEVHINDHNEHVYTLGCMPHPHCRNDIHLFGKRAHGPGHPHEHHDPGHDRLRCSECCLTSKCNKQMCGAYQPTTPTPSTTMMSTTSTGTFPPTTPTPSTATANDTCRDHEEVGFNCTSFDVYNFCTDTTGIAYAIAHSKCRKHCGFCGKNGGTTAVPVSVPQTTGGTTAVPVSVPQTTGVCEDKEDSFFQCADKPDLCVDPSIFAVQLMVHRCSKFCGLC